MKILQIIPSLASGGAERLVTDLCNEMCRQGAEVHLCIVQNPGERDFGFYLPALSDKVHFHSLNQPKGFGWKNIGQLNLLIKQLKPDVIHAHLGALLYLYFLKLLRGKYTFYYTIHNLAEKSDPNLLLRAINIFYFGLKLIRAITISEKCDISYRKFYGLKNASCIPNGREKLYPTDQYTSVSKEINSYKQSESDLVFIHVARYYPQKNQEMLVKVFNRLIDEGHAIVLLIIGDWSFCSEARELAATVKPRIHVLGTRTNVADYLLLSDAFCLTSLYEGLPISLIEAISCGCTPLCTPAGGIPDIIKHGETGFLSADFTYESYFSMIREYINHGKDLISRAKLIETYEDNFSIEITARRHLNLFSDTIN